MSLVSFFVRVNRELAVGLCTSVSRRQKIIVPGSHTGACGERICVIPVRQPLDRRLGE